MYQLWSCWCDSTGKEDWSPSLSLTWCIPYHLATMVVIVGCLLKGATAHAMGRGGGGGRSSQPVIICGGWKHHPVTRVEVCDVLGTHESNCLWQGRKPAPVLLTLSSLSDDRYVLITPGHPLVFPGAWSCAFKVVFVGWLLNVPATCTCISGTDLLRQLMCCHTETEVANQTCYLTQSQ